VEFEEWRNILDWKMGSRVSKMPVFFLDSSFFLESINFSHKILQKDQIGSQLEERKEQWFFEATRFQNIMKIEPFSGLFFPHKRFFPRENLRIFLRPEIIRMNRIWRKYFRVIASTTSLRHHTTSRRHRHDTPWMSYGVVVCQVYVVCMP